MPSAPDPDRTVRRPLLVPVLVAVLVAAVATSALAALVIGGTRAPEAAPPVAAVASTSGPDPRRDGADGFRVWAVDDAGRTVRWDPCATIAFVVDPSDAPVGALDDLDAAIGLLMAAGAPRMVVEGLTDERPSADRRPHQPERYGARWAPVLVAWARPGEGGVPLAATDRGVALPMAVVADGSHAFVTGQVVLNAARDDLEPGFEDRSRSWGATLVHELGHLIGLGHVEDARELMATAPGDGPVRLGPGDRAGLAHLADGGRCAPAPRPRSVPVRPADPDAPAGVTPGT